MHKVFEDQFRRVEKMLKIARPDIKIEIDDNPDYPELIANGVVRVIRHEFTKWVVCIGQASDGNEFETDNVEGAVQLALGKLAWVDVEHEYIGENLLDQED